jgi:protein TonB
VAVEILLIGGTVAWAVSRPVPQPVNQVVLSFAAPAVEQPEKAEPEPPRPQPIVRSQPLPKPSTKPVPKMPAPVEQQPVVEPVPTAVQQVTAATPLTAPVSPPRTQPAPPPPPPKIPEIDPTPAYNAKLAAAAQAAFSMPSVAINLGFKGRAQVQFNLRDAIVSRIELAKSSGLAAVDRAALQAVQSAKYPPPPASLREKDMAFSIWVEAY